MRVRGDEPRNPHVQRQFGPHWQNEEIVQDSGEKAEFDKASSSLDKGLESCRSVLESYRAMLTGGESPAVGEQVSDSEEEQVEENPRPK